VSDGPLFAMSVRKDIDSTLSKFKRKKTERATSSIDKLDDKTDQSMHAPFPSMKDIIGGNSGGSSRRFP